MRLLQFAVLPFFVVALGSVLLLSSCEPDAEQKRVTDYQKNDIIMSGAQETPPVPSTAIGKMNVYYTRETRTLTYSVSWSGLTGPVIAMHIHGLAPTGYAVGVVQTFTIANIVRCPASPTTACGSYSGTFQVDGFVVREADLLNGMYYINIHTAAYPGGEIRGQIRFQ